MDNCSICRLLRSHAEAHAEGAAAQRHWDRQHADLQTAYAPNEIPGFAVAGLGPRPELPTAPQGTVEERLLHAEHRIADLEDVEARLADVEQHLALTHGTDADQPQ